MQRPAEEIAWSSHALAATLRAVRKHRRLLQTQVAQALDMSRRSYLELERGSGRLTLEQLVAFAEITRSDPFALLAATLFNKPDLAVHCADRKLMTVMMIAADRFSDALGDQIAEVRPQELMSRFSETFQSIATDLQARQTDDARLMGRLFRRSDDEPQSD